MASSPPKASATSDTARWQDSASVTSQTTAAASLPASFAAFSRRSCRRATNATCAPFSARPIPMQRPSPEEPPTTATRSAGASDIELRTHRSQGYPYGAFEAPVVEGADRHVVVACLGPQGAHGALLSWAVLERVEGVPAAGVLVSDLVDLVVGNVRGHPGELFRGCGPRRVGVWVIAFPGDVVDADVVSQFDANRIGDEAGEEAFAEHLAGQLGTEVLTGPQVMHLVRAVDPVGEVRDPAGAALGQGEAQVGELLDDARPEEIGRRGADVHRLQRDHHVNGSVVGRHGDLAARAEMDRDHRGALRGGPPHGIPVLIVKAWEPQ